MSLVFCSRPMTDTAQPAASSRAIIDGGLCRSISARIFAAASTASALTTAAARTRSPATPTSLLWW